MKTLFFSNKKQCESCDGKGSNNEKLADKVSCPDCQGKRFLLAPILCGKAKWIKVFKRKLKTEGVFENVSFWAETCWRENTDGKHSVLTPKQAAIQLSHWINA